ncbi:Dynamin superfamily,Fzo/mitofusin HR2 domain,P-loop containing nucleoside triphosphate hydrolase,Dynamin- [Cinara cedri]|uniref:Dynamin superfamily,Fzo/mitofusin HR2 domain,P-loop containing nucleoside triphosphate hydrolase,Dynamin n=1 Tax=Cinara cedri TaxID=506608 RepID=A0A5E4MRE3_9HEMI|nr:Dynamin superfamily,Fzo/mitofusin HR2 domain,P-loop containing nucleoside triphosphate hydrolase,Dynamin- [Cinara cedri]
MASNINRTLEYSNPMNISHNLSTDEKISSPLQNFGKAKKQINNIFVDLLCYVAEASERIKDVNDKCPDVINTNELKSIIDYEFKVKGISEVLTRDHMKVAFFGRTSNGKSTVVNAMLGDKVLPSGIGHTTNCFLQVEGSQNGDAYLVIEGSNERQNVESVSHLAHALNHEKQLNEKELVHVYWPKDRCVLLRDDVVLVDSPGVDVTPHLDDWIDNHCIDADVFVLVANAESTLMVTEKNFFHKVSSKLSKPNIFILNNRWDASANESEFLDPVRKQHTERATDFLVKELKVCTAEEASTRIFFISAKEVLQARVQERKGLASNSGALAEGFSIRYMEFEEFERRFEECISKSAIKTKFLNHSQEGKHLIKDMLKIMDIIYNRSQEQKNLKLNEIEKCQEKLNYTEQSLISITKEMKTKIHQMVNDVEKKVSKALSLEIRRLSVLVNEFSFPFHSDPLVLNAYKKELHSYVESGLGSNLRARLSTALALNIDESQKEMIEKMSALLPEEKRNIRLRNPQREPFEVFYRLNCDNLCRDFHEHLEFKFSWGLSKLFGRVRSFSTSWSYYYSRTIMSSQFNNQSNVSINTFNRLHGVTMERNLSVISRILLTSLGTPGAMGLFIFAGFMIKTVGWRLMVVNGATYGCLYLYERMSWTTKAKEREFKRQYVRHATSKLRMIVELTSTNCSYQVQQKLSTFLAQLCELVDMSATDLIDEMKSLDGKLRILSKLTEVSKMLRNKGAVLKADLKQFEDTFLSK